MINHNDHFDRRASLEAERVMRNRDLDLAERKRRIIQGAKAHRLRQVIREINSKPPLSSDGGPH